MGVMMAIRMDAKTAKSLGLIAGTRRNKFNVAPKEDRTSDGIVFASAKEMRRYNELKLLVKSGDVLWFTRQVPFWLEGGVKYVADFVVVWVEGWHDTNVTVEDVKGYKTEGYELKKKLMAARGIEVIEV